jgi:hypothetical protein
VLISAALLGTDQAKLATQWEMQVLEMSLVIPLGLVSAEGDSYQKLQWVHVSIPRH